MGYKSAAILAAEPISAAFPLGVYNGRVETKHNKEND